VGLEGSSDNHDGVVKRSLSLLEVLRSSSSKNEGGGLGFDTLGEHVESFVSELNFFKLAAGSENVLSEAKDGGLHDGSSGLGDSKDIVFLDSSSAENVSVGEVLSGKISNGKVGEDDLGSGLDNFVELVVDNVPLGVNNFLEVVGVIDSNFSVVLLGFKFELEVEEEELGVGE